jgi:hypothetical protein
MLESCKNCKKHIVGIQYRHAYCSQQCNVEFLKGAYVCGRHGKLADRNIRIYIDRSKKRYGTIHLVCVICDRIKNRIRRAKSDDLSVNCKNCGVAFCAIGSGKSVYCSSECNYKYVFDNLNCEVHGSAPDHFKVYNKSSHFDVRCLLCEKEKQLNNVKNLNITYVKQMMIGRTKGISRSDISDDIAGVYKLKMTLARKVKQLMDEQVG